MKFIEANGGSYGVLPNNPNYRLGRIGQVVNAIRFPTQQRLSQLEFYRWFFDRCFPNPATDNIRVGLFGFIPMAIGWERTMQCTTEYY